MARKGKEIQLQQEIGTQEEWEDMLSKEGLCVVDVYQEWAGPVTPLVPNLRRLKNELGDDLLKFWVAKSDTIDALERYRGRCEPCFMFFAGGVLVAVIRGANAPLILRTITEQLAQEHKVLDGQAERKEIKDPMLAQYDRQREQEAEQEPEEEADLKGGKKPEQQAVSAPSSGKPVKEVSVVIIKPDAVQSGKSDEILEEMNKRGIEILRQEERQLTEEEVKNVYIHLQDESYFDELVAFMTSAPSIVLAITKGPSGENIIQEFRDLIGPTEVEEAKEQAPESLRAKFGAEKYMNAVHGSDSSDTAARELAFFFPDFAAPPCDGKPKVQRTLALIRPDAYKEHKEEIKEKIRVAGFRIAMEKEITLTKDQAEDFYKEHQGQDYFEELTTRMSSGPLLALGLAREDAITGWRQMLGPTKVEEAKESDPQSLRAQFSVDGSEVNMLHGSDSEETAQKEIEYFFPIQQTVAVIKPDAYGTKDEIIDKIHDAGFKIAARKETTLSKEIAEEFYADHKDKEYYNELVEHMSSGPTMFMVLSREDAVEGWRSMIGPTDPSHAKEKNPEAIRAQFGSDPLKNAVHGSSNPEHALQQITTIFGELYFNKDGTLRGSLTEEVPTKSEEGQEAIIEQNEDEYEVAPEHRDQGQVEEGGKSSPTPAQQEEPQKTEDQTPTETEAQTEQKEEPKADDTTTAEAAPANEGTADDNTAPTDNAPADDAKTETEAQEEQKSEPAPEQAKAEEDKPAEPEAKQEESKPEETQAEQTEQAEQKEEATEETQKAEEPKAEPAEQQKEEEAKPETAEEKKEEQEEKKEETAEQKTEVEQTPAS